MARIEKLEGVKPVTSIQAPARLEYNFTAGLATSRFLKGIAKKKIYGERCGPSGKVYVPPRGSDPVLGRPTTEQVEVGQKGTVTSFCVVNVQFYGQAMEVPYVCALVLLDGAIVRHGGQRFLDVNGIAQLPRPPQLTNPAVQLRS